MLLTDHKLPLGEQITGFVDWLTLHGTSFFDKISGTLGFLIHGVTNGLLWSNPLVLVALLVGLIYFIQRGRGLTMFVLASLLLTLNLGYWREVMETLAQIIFTTLVCIAVGVPPGIVATHKPWFYTTLRPPLDLIQAVPTFVYLIPALTLFSLGVVPGLIFAMISAVTASIHPTCLGVQDVSAELFDAGKTFGCSCWQLLTYIELPHTMPSIATGITQCVIFSLSTAVVVASAGADGLGKPAMSALNTADISLGSEAGLVIVLLAILLDRVCRQRAMKGR